MAVDFKKTFGEGSNSVSSNAQNERENAKVWLNIGYNVEVQTEAGETETRFVSMPVGIPVDTQKSIEIKSSNASYRDFMGARNNLLDQIQKAAAALAPGEEKMLNLEIQLRRVAEPTAAPAVDESNIFVRNIEL